MHPHHHTHTHTHTRARARARARAHTHTHTSVGFVSRGEVACAHTSQRLWQCKSLSGSPRLFAIARRRHVLRSDSQKTDTNSYLHRRIRIKVCYHSTHTHTHTHFYQYPGNMTLVTARAYLQLPLGNYLVRGVMHERRNSGDVFSAIEQGAAGRLTIAPRSP